MHLPGSVPGNWHNWLPQNKRRSGPQDQQEWPARNPTTGSLSTAKLAPFFAAADTLTDRQREFENDSAEYRDPLQDEFGEFWRGHRESYLSSGSQPECVGWSGSVVDPSGSTSERPPLVEANGYFRGVRHGLLSPSDREIVLTIQVGKCR